MSEAYDIAGIYAEMEKEIISSMQRNLSGHVKEEKRVGFDYPQWQAEKLRSLRRYQIENAKIIHSYTDGLPLKVKAILQDELKQGTLNELKKYKEVMAAGYESSVVMKDSFFKINTRKVNNLIKSVDNDLAKANHACLRYVNDAYRQVIFKSEMFVANGVYTEKKAVDKAIEEFEKRGLHCIEYANGSYHDIADYADMAVKTASQRAQLMGEGEFRKKIGNSLIKISKHGGTCPLCAKWEGRVLIDDVYSGGTPADGNYPLLSEAMAAGLYHPRCRHGAGTYYPEVDDIWNDDKSIANSNESDIIKTAGKSPGRYEDVEFNPDADFKIKLDTYPDAINDALSKECYNVAKLGSVDRKEHLSLVNLKTGITEYREDGYADSVGGTEFWDFIKQNSNNSYAFVHNHNTASKFSETDMQTLLGNNSVNMFVISRLDGKCFVVENAGKTPNSLFFDSLYEDEIKELAAMIKRGKITAGERTFLREKILVDNVIRDYTKGLSEFG